MAAVREVRVMTRDVDLEDALDQAMERLGNLWVIGCRLTESPPDYDRDPGYGQACVALLYEMIAASGDACRAHNRIHELPAAARKATRAA